jgi:hypothetical protein
MAMNPQLLHIAGVVASRLTDGILIGQTVIGEVIERAAVATAAKK